jgi:NADH dehydrogenase/putative oxidoreductase
LATIVEQTQEERFSPFVRVTLRIWVKLFRLTLEAARPLADVLIRLVIAFTILPSGLVKLTDWDKAMFLAANEYPVAWMSPAWAAFAGLSIEIAAPILLILGLFTRGAALAVALLFAVSQAVYLPTTGNLMLIAVVLWYVLSGAGPISLDRLLANGLANSAVPFATIALRWNTALNRIAAPLWLGLLRLWLAIALIAAAAWWNPSIALATWLPSSLFAGVSPVIAAVLAACLVGGLMMPVAATGLILLVASLMAMGLNPVVSLLPMMLFILLGLWGPGWPALDRLISGWLDHNILFDRSYSEVPQRWPHIVVIGAGFGGLSAVSKLRHLPVRVTLIDRNNYHLFQPLLYQIATAGLSPADVASPIRGLFRGDNNVRVVMGDVTGVDSVNRIVHFGKANRLDYDQLILATGASHSYFGKDEWGRYAPGLKTIDDAVAARAHILRAFEKAESLDDPERIRRLLTFVIVGAGPTGVELAGAIAELAKHGLQKEFRAIDPAMAKVILVQSGDRVLPAFPEDLSAATKAALEKLGVEVRLNGRVTNIAADHVRIGEDEIIATETVLWAAGVVASAASQWLGCEADRAGRVVVDDQLRVIGHENIYAIGDTAASNGWDGQPVPGLAPAAKQAGAYVAKRIEQKLRGRANAQPFSYQHQGSLATIGRKSAVADFGRFRLSGSLAWWFWGAVHVGFLNGTRNRATVLVNWVWSYFTMRQGVRLITGREIQR